MNNGFDVFWPDNAEKDLTAIIDHIAAESPQTAMSILDKIRQAASNLETMPERCRIVPELQKFGIFQYRELILPPWRIIYRISERNVFVLLVIDSRRDIEGILFDRLIGRAL